VLCLLLLLAAAAAAGGSVWCDEGMYPRKLFVEMKGGRAVWRCACFKEMGWSDVRKVNTRTSLLQHACQTKGRCFVMQCLNSNKSYMSCSVSSCG
jgi:hypothetical protein